MGIGGLESAHSSIPLLNRTPQSHSSIPLLIPRRRVSPAVSADSIDEDRRTVGDELVEPLDVVVAQAGTAVGDGAANRLLVRRSVDHVPVAEVERELALVSAWLAHPRR